jgi:hypothetical protein
MPLLARRVLPLALVFAQACGSIGGSAGSFSPTIGSPTSPSLSPSPSASPTLVVVTLADDRQTVSARVGDDIQIALGDEYQWEIDPPDGVVLIHPFQTYLLRQGTQAIWLARSVGRSTIKATGTAACASGQPCLRSAILFMVTVDVLP